jgi:hypothetical protein
LGAAAGREARGLPRPQATGTGRSLTRSTSPRASGAKRGPLPRVWAAGPAGFPIRKGISGQSGGGGPTDTEAGTDDNTAALDALNAQIAELTRQMEEAARLAEQQNALLKQQRDDANRAYAVSQSQYGTFKGFFAEMVNDYLGSRVGLGMAGLRAPAGTLMRA